jgi:hypothetical protein
LQSPSYAPPSSPPLHSLPPPSQETNTPAPGPILTLTLTEPEGRRAEDVKAVLAHYRRHHPRAFLAPTSKSKEWGLVLARLREGSTVQDLCDAIDGYHSDPWHMGENDQRKRYDSLELILRDHSHVLKGIEFHEHGPAPVASEKQLRGHRAMQEWLDMHEQQDREEAQRAAK